MLEVNLPGRSYMLKIMRKSIEAHVKGSFESSSQKICGFVFARDCMFYVTFESISTESQKYGSKEVGGLNLFIFFN